MKKYLLPFLVMATLAGTVLPSQASAPDPVKNYRRTLYLAIGQYMVTLEAPIGMCFLNESDYLEGTIMDGLRGTASKEGETVAIFTDCMAIAKLQAEFQASALEAAKHPNGSQPEAPASNSGTFPAYGEVGWVDPGNSDNDERVGLSRKEYLDARESSFRDSLMKGHEKAYKEHEETSGKQETAVDTGSGVLTMSSYIAPSSAQTYDDKVHRSADGVSLAYKETLEVDYKTVKDSNVIATTTLHQVPLEFAMHFTAKEGDEPRDFKDLYALMDTFLAQQVKLNHGN